MPLLNILKDVWIKREFEVYSGLFRRIVTCGEDRVAVFGAVCLYILWDVLNIFYVNVFSGVYMRPLLEQFVKNLILI